MINVFIFIYFRFKVFRQADTSPLYTKFGDRKMLGKYYHDQRWVYWGEVFPQPLFADTTKRLGATLNDVAVTAIARGVRIFIDSSSQLTTRPPCSSVKNKGQEKATMEKGDICWFFWLLWLFFLFNHLYNHSPRSELCCDINFKKYILIF